MFSPLADTTFSSFFSGAGLGAGHLQHLEWLLRLAPPWKMRQGSLLSWSRTAPSDAFLLCSQYTTHHSFPRTQDFLWFWVCTEPAHGDSGPARPESSPSQSPGSKMSQGRVSASLDDSVSADWGLLTFSSTVVFLFRPKTPKLQLSPVRSLASARHPDILRPLTDARIKTAGSRPLLRLPLNTGHINSDESVSFILYSTPTSHQRAPHSTVSTGGSGLMSDNGLGGLRGPGPPMLALPAACPKCPSGSWEHLPHISSFYFQQTCGFSKRIFYILS